MLDPILLPNTCHYCGKRATTSDHIVPRSLGGADAKYNRVPACEPCNIEKANSMPTCPCDYCQTAINLPRRTGKTTRNRGKGSKARQRRRRYTIRSLS